MSFVSQDYFDDLCIENYEVFDMSSPQEAVEETIKQLRSSARSSSGTACSLDHLTLTYPDESGREARNKIRSFHEAMHYLDHIEHTYLTDCLVKLDTLQTMLVDRCDSDSSIYVELFLIHDGFGVFSSLISQAPKEEWSQATDTLLYTVLKLVSFFQTKTRRSFQTSAHLFAQPLTELLEREIGNIFESTFPRISVILSIVYASILRCESNKVLWMSIRTLSGNFPSLMLSSLKLCIRKNESTVTEVQCTVCRIIASLCTFDDFRKSDDAAVVSLQSCHTNVQEFCTNGAVPMLRELLFVDEEEPRCIALVSSAFSALRAIAVQDEVVKNMVNVGVIDDAAKIFRVMCEVSVHGPCEQVVTAILGFLRNISANDDVKTTLCIGQYNWIVQCTLKAMEVYRSNVLLQEHACGLVAAMALRKPKNASALVAAGAHTSIVAAMRKHMTSVTLQRQAALAMRNLVARTPELRSLVLTECDTEVALRTIAGEHLGCQDEVYAALRDLGLDVRSVHVQQSVDGTVIVQNSLPMFGERNPNFRPDFTKSED
jgi:hypothetical protein